MARITFRLVLSIVALAMVSIAPLRAEFPTEKAPKPDPTRAKYDDACAMLAASVVAGYDDQKKEQWLSDCAAHPDVGICVGTKEFIEQSIHRRFANLTCAPGTKPAVRARHSTQQNTSQSKALNERAELIKGDFTSRTRDGYTRLVFRFPTQVGVAVTTSGTILALMFSEPVTFSPGQLDLLQDPITTMRLDPDFRALRIALARNVKVHTIPNGKRFVLDLLPENWTGLMPADSE